MCIIGCITREAKGVWGRRASTECVRERVDGRDSQTKPIRRLPNAHLVGFTGKTDRFGWVLILAGKPRSNRIVTGFPNGALAVYHDRSRKSPFIHSSKLSLKLWSF